MYHGTEKERGEKILADQKMPVSISTDRKQHWLGDGIYLYRELIYAFRWILLMYEERTNHHDVTDSINFKEYKKRFLRLEQFKRNNTNECGSKVKYIDRQRGEKYGKRKNIGRGIK